MRVAKENGVDIEKLRKDTGVPEVQEPICASMRLSRALGFNGTPPVVIGDNLVAGFVERAELERYVADARGKDDLT